MLVLHSLAHFDLAALPQLLQPRLVILVCTVFPAQSLQLAQEWEHAVGQGRALTPGRNDIRDGEEQCKIVARQGHLGECRRGPFTRLATNVTPVCSCIGCDFLNRSLLLPISRVALATTSQRPCCYSRNSMFSNVTLLRVRAWLQACALPYRDFMYLATASLLGQSLMGSPRVHTCANGCARATMNAASNL